MLIYVAAILDLHSKLLAVEITLTTFMVRKRA